MYVFFNPFERFLRCFADDCILLIVNVESEGPYAPENLLPVTNRILRQKTAALKKAAEGLRNQGDDKEEESKSNDGANANGADGDVVMMDS